MFVETIGPNPKSISIRCITTFYDLTKYSNSDRFYVPVDYEAGGEVCGFAM
jgi:hypothetical protein